MKEQQVETDKFVAEAQSTRKKRTFVMSPSAWFATGGIALFVGIVGFVGGLQVGKQTNTNANASNTAMNRNTGDMRGGQLNDSSFSPPTTSSGLSASGSITAVSATSITVKDTRTGQGVTFAITSSTGVTNASATASVSDLNVGDSVRVQSASDTSTDATLIELNPSTRGPGMMGAY